ncbi:MAG: DUF5060 domain-containing protein [Crocinitomicaceae bacterium]|nr:DUF5060 domain-containing protein [Crocinitomicaceae bacterium]
MKSFVTIVFLIVHCSLFSQNALPQSISFVKNNNQIRLVWYTPTEHVGIVKKYHKLEIGLSVPRGVENEIRAFLQTSNRGINPFNPNEIAISAVFTAPSGKKEQMNGFYYQPFYRDVENNQWIQDTTNFPWRIRFSPDEIGQYNVSVNVVVRGQQVEEPILFSFDAIESEHKGYIVKGNKGDETDRYLRYRDSGETFFCIGHNISHSDYVQLTPKSGLRHIQWLKELSENGGNFFRLELGGQNALPDWDNYKNYFSKMDEMWEYDQLIDTAFAMNLYFILFRHHVELNYKGWPENWSENPYKNSFQLMNFSSYFTNNEIDQWQRYCLRYIFARWGYNPSLAFYGYSEVDNFIKPMMETESKTYKDALQIFEDWNKNQFNYIKDTLQNKHILTLNTYASINDFDFKKPDKSMLSYLDVVGFHTYKIKKDANWNRAKLTDILWKTWKKPIVIEEMGFTDDYLEVYCCTDIDFHNSIWATALNGNVGTGMHWWWDRGVHDFGFYILYQNLANFFKGEDLVNYKYTPQQWKNASNIKKATIETFMLINSNQERVLGWLHNATFYWRNSYAFSPCMQELTETGQLKFQCDMEDGYIIPSKKQNYQEDRIKDNYTERGGIVQFNQGIRNPTFTISGLKKKRLYRIEFYKTGYVVRNQLVKELTQQISTKANGKLVVPIPDLDVIHPDYGFKVSLVHGVEW